MHPLICQLSHLVSARNAASIEDLKTSGINSIQLDVNNIDSIKVAVGKYEFLAIIRSY